MNLNLPLRKNSTNQGNNQNTLPSQKGEKIPNSNTQERDLASNFSQNQAFKPPSSNNSSTANYSSNNGQPNVIGSKSSSLASLNEFQNIKPRQRSNNSVNNHNVNTNIIESKLNNNISYFLYETFQFCGENVDMSIINSQSSIRDAFACGNQIEPIIIINSLKEIIEQFIIFQQKAEEQLYRYKEQKQCNDYQSQLQKLQAEIRQHIRIEQQLKLYVETTQSKLEQVQQIQSSQMQEMSQRIDNLLKVSDNLQESLTQQEQQIESLTRELESKNEEIQSLAQQIQSLEQSEQPSYYKNGPITRGNISIGNQGIQKHIISDSFIAEQVNNNHGETNHQMYNNNNSNNNNNNSFYTNNNNSSIGNNSTMGQGSHQNNLINNQNHNYNLGDNMQIENRKTDREKLFLPLNKLQDMNDPNGKVKKSITHRSRQSHESSYQNKENIKLLDNTNKSINLNLSGNLNGPSRDQNSITNEANLFQYFQEKFQKSSQNSEELTNIQKKLQTLQNISKRNGSNYRFREDTIDSQRSNDRDSIEGHNETINRSINAKSHLNGNSSGKQLNKNSGLFQERSLSILKENTNNHNNNSMINASQKQVQSGTVTMSHILANNSRFINNSNIIDNNSMNNGSFNNGNNSSFNMALSSQINNNNIGASFLNQSIQSKMENSLNLGKNLGVNNSQHPAGIGENQVYSIQNSHHHSSNLNQNKNHMSQNETSHFNSDNNVQKFSNQSQVSASKTNNREPGENQQNKYQSMISSFLLRNDENVDQGQNKTGSKEQNSSRTSDNYSNSNQMSYQQLQQQQQQQMQHIQTHQFQSAVTSQRDREDGKKESYDQLRAFMNSPQFQQKENKEENMSHQYIKISNISQGSIETSIRSQSVDGNSQYKRLVRGLTQLDIANQGSYIEN